MWRLLLLWIGEQKSVVAIAASMAVFGVVLLLRYQYDTWWPWGIVLSFVLGVIGLINVRD